MLAIFSKILNLGETDDATLAAVQVLSEILLPGDVLIMQTTGGKAITFADWAHLGKGKFQPRDFRLDVLTGPSAFRGEDSLFAKLETHEIFIPVKTYLAMTIRDLAAAGEKYGP